MLVFIFLHVYSITKLSELSKKEIGVKTECLHKKIKQNAKEVLSSITKLLSVPQIDQQISNLKEKKQKQKDFQFKQSEPPTTSVSSQLKIPQSMQNTTFSMRANTKYDNLNKVRAIFRVLTLPVNG